MSNYIAVTVIRYVTQMLNFVAISCDKHALNKYLLKTLVQEGKWKLQISESMVKVNPADGNCV